MKDGFVHKSSSSLDLPFHFAPVDFQYVGVWSFRLPNLPIYSFIISALGAHQHYSEGPKAT